MNTVDDRPRDLLIRTEREEGDWVRLSVKDAGVGFDPQTMDKLFEAFYSTKNDGMGVGLSVSRSIIENHQGRLWAVLNDGPGLRFHFLFRVGRRRICPRVAKRDALHTPRSARRLYNARMLRPVERIVDLLDPRLNQIHNMSLDEGRRRVLGGDPAEVRAIDGSFALIAVDGVTVRMARSLDRPMRYFLAKRHEGPALFVSDRIDTLQRALDDAGLGQQFHPSYTRMVPAHHVVEIALVGCPDPDPLYTRFFTPARGTLPPDLDEIGRRYIGALAEEIRKWLLWVERESSGAPIGVSFSGGIDSGSVLLVTYWTMLQLGMSPARLKAFVLDLGDGPDVDQARAFLDESGLGMFLEEIPGRPGDLDADRRCACSRTTRRSTSNARRWDWPCAGAFASAIPTGAIFSMATAATRT